MHRKHRTVSSWDQLLNKLLPTRLLCHWGFSRQEYWSGLEWDPSPGDLPNPGIKPRSCSLQVDSLLAGPPGKPKYSIKVGYSTSQPSTTSLVTGLSKWRQRNVGATFTADLKENLNLRFAHHLLESRYPSVRSLKSPHPAAEFPVWWTPKVIFWRN